MVRTIKKWYCPRHDPKYDEVQPPWNNPKTFAKHWKEDPRRSSTTGSFVGEAKAKPKPKPKATKKDKEEDESRRPSVN